MSQLRALADEFYDAVGLVEGESRPAFVSDEASLYDIQVEDDARVVQLVESHYGVTLRVPDDLRRPFWQLLDDLQRLRS
jgi:hypothetical protein